MKKAVKKRKLKTIGAVAVAKAVRQIKKEMAKSKPKRKASNSNSARVPAVARVSTALATPRLVRLPMKFSKQELSLIHDTVAPGTTPTEFQFYMYQARMRKLNPLLGQIYCVMRKTWNADKNQYDRNMTVQVGIDGYRLIAQRTGEYCGQAGPFWIGKDEVKDGKVIKKAEWSDVWNEDTVPVAAKVGVWRTGFADPVWGVAKYSEYVQRSNKSGQPTKMWKTMPTGQLAKCAEALALRKAFPEALSGIYTNDETAFMDRDEKLVSDIDDKIKIGKERAIYILAAKVETLDQKGIFTKEGIKLRMKERYGSDSAKDLTAEQLDEIAAILKMKATELAKKKQLASGRNTQRSQTNDEPANTASQAEQTS